jgi:hypothetical protein
VVTSSEAGDARMVIARVVHGTGVLTRDSTFQDHGSVRPGISLDHESLRHAGKPPIAHAAVFGARR